MLLLTSALFLRPTNQDRTLHFKAFRKITPEGTDLHPGQQVPVHTLSKMDEPLRSFHIPAYRGTDLFQERGERAGPLNAFVVVPLRGILAS